MKSDTLHRYHTLDAITRSFFYRIKILDSSLAVQNKHNLGQLSLLAASVFESQITLFKILFTAIEVMWRVLKQYQTETNFLAIASTLTVPQARCSLP